MDDFQGLDLKIMKGFEGLMIFYHFHRCFFQVKQPFVFWGGEQTPELVAQLVVKMAILGSGLPSAKHQAGFLLAYQISILSHVFLY